MDVISIMATAIALGAEAGLEDPTARVVKDGYTALKQLILQRLPTVFPSVEQLEQAPKSMARRAVVEEELNHAGAANDTEFLAQVKAFLELVEQQTPGVATVIGVSLNDIRSASLSIRDVVSSGSGVTVDKAEIGGDISIEDIRAGTRAPDTAKNMITAPGRSGAAAVNLTGATVGRDINISNIRLQGKRI